MAINGEHIVGVTRDGYQSESVASVLVYDDNCEGSGRSTSIPTLAVDDCSIRCGDETSRRGRYMIPSQQSVGDAVKTKTADTYQSPTVMTVSSTCNVRKRSDLKRRKKYHYRRHTWVVQGSQIQEAEHKASEYVQGKVGIVGVVNHHSTTKAIAILGDYANRQLSE